MRAALALVAVCAPNPVRAQSTYRWTNNSTAWNSSTSWNLIDGSGNSNGYPGGGRRRRPPGRGGPGELIAITPEPGSVLAGLGLAGAVRRRRAAAA